MFALSNFRSRITLLFSLVVLAMSLLSSMLVSSIVAERIAADQGDMLEGLSSNVASVLAEGLKERLQAIEMLAVTMAATGNGEQELRAKADALDRLQRIGPVFAWVGLTDTQGKVMVAKPELLVGMDVSQRPWFQKASQSSHVGDVHPAKLLAKFLPPSNDGGPMRFVDFAVPVRAQADGRPMGVLGAHGSWDWAGEVVESLKGRRLDHRGIQVFILDRGGRTLYSPPGVPMPESAVPPHPSKPGVVTWPDGQRYFTAAAPLLSRSTATDMGWLVVTRQPEALAMRAVDDARRTIVGMGALAALAITALAWLLTGRLTRPLHEIAVAAQRIEAGDLDAHLPSAVGGGELKRLSSALQSMTNSLIRSRSAVEQANASLEARVAERTEALARANAALERLARQDGLTGLPNRRMADERLMAELSRHQRSGQPVSLLLLDIDHFKRINDEHGHATGDDALRAVAQCLAATCRGTDFVARFGGEEFLALLPETGSLQGAMVAEKLRLAIGSLLIHKVGRLTVSIGLAEAAPGAPADQQRLLQQADTALYAAKEAGRNRVMVFDAVARAVAA